MPAGRPRYQFSSGPGLFLRAVPQGETDVAGNFRQQVCQPPVSATARVPLKDPISIPSKGRSVDREHDINGR